MRNSHRFLDGYLRWLEGGRWRNCAEINAAFRSRRFEFCPVRNMAKGKWFKEGAECWVYSTLEIQDDQTHKHWACRGKIITIGNRMTYVLLDFDKRAVGKFGNTEDTLATPFFTDDEVFYSLGMIRRRYGNDFEIRDEKWS